MKPYEVNITKPLWETSEGFVVGIWDKRVNDAIKARTMILIRTKGVAKMFYPKWVRQHCKKIEKIYLRPDEPMILYEVFISKPKKKTEDEKLKEMSEQGVFG